MKILRKIKAMFITLTIAIWLPIIIFQIRFVSPKDNGRDPRRQCRWFFKLHNLKLDFIGEFDKFENTPGMIVLNHQSVADIISMEGYHPSNICWVAKKELGEIPLYGHALKVPSMILLDREDKKAIIQLLKESREKIKQNRPLAIFPEGTRSDGGEKFLPFKPGAKILAEKHKLKIQPIVLINTRKLYSTSPMYSQANYARIVILPSFMPDFEDEMWYQKLESQMQEVYTKHYNELNNS